MKLFRFNEPTFVTLMPFLAIGFLVFFWQSTPDLPVHNSRFLAFGTLMDVSIVGVPEKLAEDAVTQLEKDFEEMHKTWHAWDPGPLGKVNEQISVQQTVSAPPLVISLTRASKELSEKSDHLFNPAIGKLVELWGFHQDNPHGRQPPDAEQIGELVNRTPRMTDLAIEDNKISSDNDAVQLDFGAIGKGYGIDRAIDKLKQMGIENAIVNAGGDLRSIGSRAGTPWRIAIKRPTGAGVLGVIETDGDESIFTSGDYERNYDWEGKRYHHILDPRTGKPAEGVSSVTVIHNNATTADAAATALFIAGPDNWFRIAQQMGVKYVLMIDSEGTLHMNPAMQKRVELLHGENKIELSPPLS